MEDEIEQLRTLVGDLFSKMESLEERISLLEEEREDKPKGPEPILTCVQCNADYKESENADGYCKYHNGTLNYSFKTRVTCCNKSADNVGDLVATAGCTKGKHQSKHHTKFLYTNYLVFMSSLCDEAKETWLEMDIYDYVAGSCLWAEVGVSSQNDVFVVAGPKYSPEVCGSVKVQELKKCKKGHQVLFEKSDSIGWCLKAELVASGSTVEGIIVTLKTAWSKVPYTKKVSFSLEADGIKVGKIECVSDPRPEEPTVEYTVPEESKTGPMLEAGEDYSQGRKSDYPTETNDDMFGIEMKQLGQTEVYSDSWATDGQWSNFFSANIKVINSSLDIVSVVDVIGEYQNSEGQWVSCDVEVKMKDSKAFLETKDFLIDGAAPTTLLTRLGIKIQDERVPSDNRERSRAHYSLPQPLLLRVTLVDNHEKRTASLIFEQGNKPLPLATKEKRQTSWSKKQPLLFHMYADDVGFLKRSDVALYYDEDMRIRYRPAPNDNGGTVFYVYEHELEGLAYKAKKSGQKEQEIKSFKKENKGSVVEAFAVVDLEYQFTFAIKLVITTPTSSATGYFLLPKMDYSKSTISVSPAEVEVKGDLTVQWDSLPVSKNDMIEVYSRFGRKSLSWMRPLQKDGSESATTKAPASPGEYEVRYYPSCLKRSATGLRHSVCVATAKFTVVTA